MHPAAIIASIPAATSLVEGVAHEVRAGSASFAEMLSDTLQRDAQHRDAKHRDAQQSASPLPFTSLINDLRSQVTTLGPVDLATTDADADQVMEHLRTLIRERLEEAGIEDLDQLELQLDASTGRITVVGDHPDRALIEASLNDDAALVDAFARLAKSLDATVRLTMDETPDDSHDEAVD